MNTTKELKCLEATRGLMTHSIDLTYFQLGEIKYAISQFSINKFYLMYNCKVFYNHN